MNEGFYIIATGLIMMAYFGVRAYFQRHYPEIPTKATDAEARRQKSTDSLVAAGQIPVLIYLLTPALSFAQVPIPDWGRWLGALITLLGVGLFYWTHRLLGPNWMPGLVLRQEHTLVTSGPYRYIRHPMYVAILIVGFGITILTANTMVGIGLIVPVITMIVQRIPAEEKALTARFGDRYRTYAEDTGALFPKLFFVRSNYPE